MIVKAKTASFENAPEELLRSGWHKESVTWITVDKKYTVYAILVFKHEWSRAERLVDFQIIDDAGVPSFMPAILFEVVDRRIPSDWECNLFPSGIFVIGPPWFVESEESYVAMVELEPEPMKRLWERVKQEESQDSSHD